ncbi:MAG: DUF1786 domain-containing protein [Actinobacteria bacterium]|nr:DUF1786 domain-containing protein [Actinomycetota bacterium]
MKILAADIGHGTADLLVFDSDLEIENCAKMVVPSRTQMVARRITEATGRGLPVSMSGPVMGGGPCGAALKKHLEAGLLFFADPTAALTFHDDISKVEGWGVTVIDDPEAALPAGGIIIKSGDLDPGSLSRAFSELGIGFRFDGVAIAVQDHGYSPGASNRRRRFSLWRGLLADNADLASLAFPAESIPQSYTRMKSAASIFAGFERVLLMDTGPAALLGATLAAQPGAGARLVANIGNGHSLAAIVTGGCIDGLFEHHTGMLERESFDSYMRRFLEGGLSDDEVFDGGGHGCIPPSRAYSLEELGPLLVTGPRREIVAGGSLQLEMAAPFGDMMLTGCFGLVAAWRLASRDRAF